MKSRGAQKMENKKKNGSSPFNMNQNESAQDKILQNCRNNWNYQ